MCMRNNTAYLVGITSWGDDNCLSDIPGVYTRVQSYAQWMDRIIENTNNCVLTA